MAVVDLEESLYQVTEGQNEVELCIVLSSPNINCPVTFSFEVQLFTDDGMMVK